ncbi:serine/arginine repetitive matrix protein 1-like isoform X3 [Elysia marginata]|uniref:Serine/arginine repetitive matrix protein 1-like isoform X3 n=1 Tax=Elysia marginata TaxID=1093978 RepID=A0AAV4IE84_9GAST|nr:serine/arginine repetitive matrix protein 1-like isoform X3 [Elysia marginata]
MPEASRRSRPLGPVLRTLAGETEPTGLPGFHTMQTYVILYSMPNRILGNLILQATAVITAVPLAEQDALRQTFQRLDTDADGHLKYNQLKTQLPKKFTREQERFTEEVYNLINSITFFGVDEFMVMNRLSQCVESLTGRAAESFETLDFTVLSQHLLKYIGLFDEMDKGYSGKISLDSLQKILSDTVSPLLITDSALWDEALDSISADFSSEVSKVVFIAHIPLFLSLETAFK